MKLFNKLKQKFKSSPDYHSLYTAKQTECDKWEFKYNKLRRQLEDILKETKL